MRTDDLPLSAPPAPTLVAARDGERVRVSIQNVAGPFTVRWESDGAVEGDGPAEGWSEALWTPMDDEDQLRVAVRTRDGVAVVSVRASAVGA